MRTAILTFALVLIQPLASWACGPDCQGDPAQCAAAAAVPFGEEGPGCGCMAAQAAMQAGQVNAGAKSIADEDASEQAAGPACAHAAPAHEKLLEQPTERQTTLEMTGPKQAQAESAAHDKPLEQLPSRQAELEMSGPKRVQAASAAHDEPLEHPTERQVKLVTTSPKQAEASAAQQDKPLENTTAARTEIETRGPLQAEARASVDHDKPLERPSARQKDLETPSPRQLDIERGR